MKPGLLSGQVPPARILIPSGHCSTYECCNSEPSHATAILRLSLRLLARTQPCVLQPFASSRRSRRRLERSGWAGRNRYFLASHGFIKFADPCRASQQCQHSRCLEHSTARSQAFSFCCRPLIFVPARRRPRHSVLRSSKSILRWDGRMLIMYHTRPRFLTSRTVPSHIGVREIGPSDRENALMLCLRGLFPFTASDFAALEHRPSATGKSYWITELRSERKIDNSVAPKFSQRPDIKVQADPQELDVAKQSPEIRDLAESGQLSRVLALSPGVRGSHLFFYHQTPDMRALLAEWTAAASCQNVSSSPSL